MSNEPSQSPLHREVQYPRRSAALAVTRDVPYSRDERDGRVMDLYAVTNSSAPRATLIIASGYPAAGLEKYTGHSARTLPAMTSWAQLLAEQGFAVVVYDAVDPATDLACVAAWLRAEGARVGVDASRLGVLATSGNSPVALAAVAAGGLRCAILLYAFAFDEGDSRTVEAASRQFGFANASAHLTTNDLPDTTHWMVVRAGRDAFPGLNASLDRFAAAALRRNLPITIINHASGTHAFDVMDAGSDSQFVIRQVLEFARFRLRE